MKVYLSTRSNEMLTEEEAMEIATEIVENNEYHIDILDSLNNYEIWDMLTEEARNTIFNRAITEALEEDFIVREFE